MLYYLKYRSLCHSETIARKLYFEREVYIAANSSRNSQTTLRYYLHIFSEFEMAIGNNQCITNNMYWSVHHIISNFFTTISWNQHHPHHVFGLRRVIDAYPVCAAILESAIKSTAAPELLLLVAFLGSVPPSSTSWGHGGEREVSMVVVWWN
jgi:hypothetical protein